MKEKRREEERKRKDSIDDPDMKNKRKRISSGA